MKRKMIFLMCICFFANYLTGWAQGFVHPGALHTQEDFDRIKAQLLAGEPSVVQAYENLKNNQYAQSNVTTYPTETIVRGGGSGENYMNAARGAAMAYQNALRWKISGDAAHAEKAIQILNAWAAACKYVSGDSNQSLASGLYGYEFANAAELMRDYPGWKPADFQKFKDFMLYVFYPRAIDFLKRRHDTWNQGRPGHYWSNWGLCNALAVMSIGILCDDAFIYNQGVFYYKYDQVGNFPCQYAANIMINCGLTEFIGNLVPAVEEDNRGPYGYLGQMQESGRDQGHALMALGLAVDICQVGWNQGDDMFALMDNRLAAGVEFVAAYNSGTLEATDLPWTEYWYQDVRTAIHNSWKQTEINAGGRGDFRPYWDRIIGHYEGIKGVTMTYSHQMKNKQNVDNGGGYYGQTSGGFDHLGFTTLTCTRPVIASNQAPVVLTPTIIYNNTTYERGEYSGVPPGSVVKFSPKLPNGVTDTGNWKWSTGATTKDLQITATKSGLYRVTYTGANGVKSTQLFSIAVTGDCSPDRLSQTITVNDVVYNDTVITVLPSESLTLSVQSSMGYGSIKWSDQSTSYSITIVSTKDSVYTATFTNQGGKETKLNFYVKVSPILPSFSVDGGAVQDKSIASVAYGQSVLLAPRLKSGMENGTWKWNDGSTNASLLVNNVRGTKHYTVIYTYNNVNYTINYSIYINELPAGPASDPKLYVSPATVLKPGSSYFMYNVGKQKYMTQLKPNDGGGSSYDTNATLADSFPKSFLLEQTDNAYLFKVHNNVANSVSAVSGLFASSSDGSVYTDCGSADASANRNKWTITSGSAAGMFKIGSVSAAGKTLAPQNANSIRIYAVANGTYTDQSDEWAFYPADMITLYGWLKEALGSLAVKEDETVRAAFDAGITAYYSKNLTTTQEAINRLRTTMGSYILNAGFDSGINEWCFNGSTNRGDVGVNFSSAEIYQKVRNLYQIITNLPAGTYKLSAQAFYQSNGSNQAFLYAGTNEVGLPVKTGTESNMETASQSFAAGIYPVELEFTHANDGDLIIGINSKANNMWSVFDSFKLTRIDTYTTELPPNPVSDPKLYAYPATVLKPGSSYFMYNVGKQKYMTQLKPNDGGSNNYDANATLVAASPKSFLLDQGANDYLFKINNNVSNSVSAIQGLFASTEGLVFTDCAATDAAANRNLWTITDGSVAGMFKIGSVSAAGKTLAPQNANSIRVYAVTNGTYTDQSDEWVFYPADVITLYGWLKEAFDSLSVNEDETVRAAFDAGIVAYHSKNLTTIQGAINQLRTAMGRYILNAGFDNGIDEWCFNGSTNRGDVGVNFSSAEIYRKVRNLYQIITDLPAGTYTLSAQAFYRNDGGDQAFLYAGTNEVQLPLRTGTENNMEAASQSFASGIYPVELEFTQAKDGDLMIGINSKTNNIWSIFDSFELTRMDTYTKELPASPASDPKLYVSPATVLKPGSSYFMYNVGKQKYMTQLKPNDGGGSNYDTNATLADSSPKSFLLEQTGNAYLFKVHNNVANSVSSILGLFAGSGDGSVYTDCTSADASANRNQWTITNGSASGMFKIGSVSAARKTLAPQNANSIRVYAVTNGTYTDQSDEWAFYPADMITLYGWLKEAFDSLSVNENRTVRKAFEAGITAYHSKNLTTIQGAINQLRIAMGRYILNAGFDSGIDEWCFNGSTNRGDVGVNFSSAEIYRKVRNLYQIITNLPAGTYTLSAQAFYRNDGGDQAFLYAGTNEVQLPLRTGTENNMEAASQSFASGIYPVELEFTHANDGDLMIGINSKANNIWSIFDSFQLTRTNVQIRSASEETSLGKTNVIENAVYPNPVTDYLTVKIAEECQTGMIELYTIEGQKVQSVACVKGENVLNISKLQNGLYIIVLKMNAKTEMFRIIKK